MDWINILLIKHCDSKWEVTTSVKIAIELV